MLRYLACGLLCSYSVSASAQFTNEAAIEEIAQTIIRQVGTEYACELRVLWIFSTASRAAHVVRVLPDGRECTQALAKATQSGRDFSIRFATLDDLEDERAAPVTSPARAPTARRRIRDQTPDPPFTYDLIDDRIEQKQ